ncbi:MAG: hypothetical protein JXA23_04545, partial [Bacteroidales bacterium]|nr:hypothetical protein [Bacteroidales bacterium]
KPVGEFDGYAPVIKPGGKISLKNILPEYGKIKLQINVTGKDSRSSGFAIGFDGIELIPKRTFIPDWYIIGPFPNPRITETQRLGLDSIYPPEITIDTNMRYSGDEGQQIRWHYIKTPENGYVSLCDKAHPSELVVTYAVTYVYSLQEKDALLMIGSDDGAKVIFNNKEIYRFLGVRIAEPDQAIIPVHLRVGWNKLLLKIENNLGGYAFYARFLDPGESLYYSAKQEWPPKTWFGKK